MQSMSTRISRMITFLVFFICIGCGTVDADTSTDTSIVREGYPSGPFGTAEGAILDNLEFQDTSGAPFKLETVYQDSSKKLLVISTTAGWCTACKEEQPELQSLYLEHGADGLEIIVGIFEDAQFQPATPALAQAWKDEYKLTLGITNYAYQEI